MTTQPQVAVEQTNADSWEDADAMDAVRRALRGLRFGQITVIVQDGLVIQVDRTERRRLRTNRQTKHL